MKSSHPPLKAGTVRGFSMIEVLVTLLIVSIALLGTAGLQAYSMRMNQASQFRSQAVFLVADLAERIEANKAQAVLGAGGYRLDRKTAADFVPTGNTDCMVGLCSGATLAAFDLAQWQAAVADPRNLPQSEWEVTYTQLPGSANAGTYTITVGWVDRQVDVAYAAATSNAINATGSTGTGERFFHTATRFVFE